MKQIILLIGFLTLFFSVTTSAQLRPAQSQYLQEKGAFVNPSFEQGYKGWEITGCSKSLEANVPYLNKTLKLSCSNETFSIKQESTKLAGSGLDLIHSCKIKATSNGARIRHIEDGVASSELKLITSGDYKTYNNDYLASATSNGLEIYSTFNFTGDLYIDDCYVGMKPDGYLPYQLPELDGGKFLYTNGVVTSFLDVDERTNVKKNNLLECATFDGCGTSEWVITTNAGLDDSGGSTRTLEKASNNSGTYLISGLNFAPPLDYTISSKATKTTGDYNGKPMLAQCEIRTLREDVKFQVLVDGLLQRELKVNNNDKWNYYSIRFTGGATSLSINIDGATSSEDFIKVDNCYLGKEVENSIYFEDFDDTPVGTIISYASEKLPDGYLKADGACLAKAEYATLYDVIEETNGSCDSGSGSGSGFNLPDLVTDNRYLRQAGGSLNVGDTQVDDLGSHSHGSGVYVPTAWSKQVYGYTGSTVNLNDTNQFSQSHRQAVTSTTGGSETRPNTYVVNYIIKVRGKSLSNTVAQKTLSPDKAGFMLWSVFDKPVEGHLKADGSCVLKSLYPDYVANVGNLYGDCTIAVSNDGVRLPDLLTDNRFVRSSGGSLAVGTTQTDENKSHNHIDGNARADGFPYANGIYGSFTSGTGIIPSQSQGTYTRRFSYTSTQGTTEARPNNIAFVPFIRMFDRDVVYGKFDAIEEITADLTAQTANRITTGFNGIGEVLTEDYSGTITCTRITTGTFNCAINGITLQEIPAFSCVISDSAVGSRICAIRNKTTSSFQVQVTRSDTATLEDRRFDVTVIKQGADYNKSFTGAVIKVSKYDGFQIGDCKMSLLDDTAFNKLHSGEWVKMSGQDITGSKLADFGGFTTMPDATTNGTFFRQVGGLSGALRTYQADIVGQHNHTINVRYGATYNGGQVSANSLGSNSQNLTAPIANTGSGIGNETRSKNIAMNFYCRID
jgi:microcystin-dependent protein